MTCKELFLKTLNSFSSKEFLCSLVSKIARSGTIPSATKIDAISTKIIVNGIEEIN